MINEALLLGHVGKKDTKTIKNGGQMTSIALATSTSYKDANGVQQKRTTWHNVHFFSKLSDIAENFVKVGDLICVRGEIMHRKIETGERAGQNVYAVNAHEIKFIPLPKRDAEHKKETNGNKRADDYDDLNDSIHF